MITQRLNGLIEATCINKHVVELPKDAVTVANFDKEQWHYTVLSRSGGVYYLCHNDTWYRVPGSEYDKARALERAYQARKALLDTLRFMLIDSMYDAEPEVWIDRYEAEEFAGIYDINVQWEMFAFPHNGRVYVSISSVDDDYFSGVPARPATEEERVLAAMIHWFDRGSEEL